MKNIFIITISLVLSSCYTTDKANRRMIKIHTHYPEILAAFCAQTYPPIEYVRDSIVYRAGKEIISYAYIDCDTVRGTKATKFKIPCPGNTRVDTVWHYKEKQAVNKAAIAVLENKLTDALHKNAVLRNTNKILLCVTAVLALYFLFKTGIIKFAQNIFRL